MEVLGRYGNLWYQGKRLRALFEMDLPEPTATSPRTPKRVCRQLDEAEVAELVAGYAAGEHVSALAARFSVNPTTVEKYTYQHGLPRRQVPLQPEQIEEATRLYQTGQSVKMVARQLGVGDTTIRRALTKAGVTMRSRGRKPRSG